MEQIKQILKNKKIYLRDFIAIIVIFFLSLFVEQVLLPVSYTHLTLPTT